MVNGNWFGQFRPDAQVLPSQFSPTQMQQGRTSPTQQYVQPVIEQTIIPHFHPSHLTTVNQQHLQHQHHFPHTTSQTHQRFETNRMCGTPYRPPMCWNQQRR